MVDKNVLSPIRWNKPVENIGTRGASPWCESDFLACLKNGLHRLGLGRCGGRGLAGARQQCRHPVSLKEAA